MTRCPTCHQKIRPPRTHRLNNNTIYYLSEIYNIIKNSDKKFIETEEMYGIEFKGTNTAENTKLKYFGAIEPFYTGDEEDRGVKRSGKWKLTDEGVLFLIRHGTLPSSVTVVDEEVTEKGKEIYIDDNSLEWYSHRDYWNDVMENLR